MTPLLSKRQVAAMTGFHPEHLMRLVRQGKFPKPIKFGPSTNCAVRFVETEVDAWIADRHHPDAIEPSGAQRQIDSADFPASPGAQ